MNESGLKYFNLCKVRIPRLTSELKVSQIGLEKKLVYIKGFFVMVGVSIYILEFISLINSEYILPLINTKGVIFYI